uniref:Cytosolic carboxypeptidase 1 n=1 Tax=Plectus sambesii TaxID=2011161 RepID=A0A914XTX5_9BILA
SGKDQLVKTGALELCEQAIKKLAEDKQHGASLPSEILADVERLQHSICTLCMRCLPVRQFPLGKHPFPLTFPLPTTQSPTKLTSGKSEDVESSDEDNEDEDDDIIVFGEDGELVRSDEEDTEQQDEGASNENGALSQLDRRKLNELDASYRKFFKELLEGAMIVKQPIAKMQSPKVGVANHKARKSRSRTRKHSDSLARKLPETKTVGRFVKIAYPELVDPGIELPLQPMARFPDALQETVVHELARARQGLDFSSKVVFDLDKLISEADPHEMQTPLKNNDRARIGKIDASINHLLFESRFECGNLRRATQVGPAHYELILSPDVNQNRPHFQWFYFEVSNNEANLPYTFEIINCLKTHSMFSTGMQPVMFSTSEAAQARPGWVRAGHSVCYYRNLYTEHQSGKKKSAGETRSYFSVRFTITFRHKADVCYLAYHYPYTYTYLQAKLECLLANPGPNVHVRSEKLCDSLAGNAVPILTITAAGSREEVSQREIVFLSGRVHPGESNASWMMQGCISFLLSNAQKAIDLRERFIFKLVPMLNPDGVINGSHRCSLVGQDLNRQWDNPSSVLHPTVYHTKGLLQWLVDVQKVFLALFM